MSRADFDWCVVMFNGKAHVAIVDKDCGGTSVTNDAEAVLEDIRATFPEIRECKIVYRDSQGDWDYLEPICDAQGHGDLTRVRYRPGPRGIQAARLEELVAKA